MGLLKESRKELISIFVVLATYGLLSIALNLFPFQKNSLFADAPTSYEAFEIYHQGEALSVSNFQMQNPYDGDPLLAAGRIFPTIYRWGDRLSEDEISVHLTQQREQNPDSPRSLCIHRITWKSAATGQFGLSEDEWYTWDKSLRKIVSHTDSSDCPAEVVQ